MKRLFFIAVICMLSSHSLANQASSYVGQENRDIKALSKSEIEGYHSGKGMGYAKAAELNHYPGPKHVLELSEQLNLTTDQKNKTQNLFDKIKQEAIKVGKAIVAQEDKLNHIFATETIDDNNLRQIFIT